MEGDRTLNAPVKREGRHERVAEAATWFRV